jgi:hypothetical protein
MVTDFLIGAFIACGRALSPVQVSDLIQPFGLGEGMIVIIIIIIILLIIIIIIIIISIIIIIISIIIIIIISSPKPSVQLASLPQAA